LGALGWEGKVCHLSAAQDDEEVFSILNDLPAEGQTNTSRHRLFPAEMI